MSANESILQSYPDSANSQPLPPPIVIGNYPPHLKKYVGKSKAICADLSQVQYWAAFDLLVFVYDCRSWRKTYAEYLLSDDAEAMERNGWTRVWQHAAEEASA